MALLNERGIEYRRINYYQNPIDRATLVRLLAAMDARPRDIMRTGEAIYKELELGTREVSDEELINLMIQHPDLLQRPILEVGDRAALGRPTENLTELLEKSE